MVQCNGAHQWHLHLSLLVCGPHAAIPSDAVPGGQSSLPGVRARFRIEGSGFSLFGVDVNGFGLRV